MICFRNKLHKSPSITHLLDEDKEGWLVDDDGELFGTTGTVNIPEKNVLPSGGKLPGTYKFCSYHSTNLIGCSQNSTSALPYSLRKLRHASMSNGRGNETDILLAPTELRSLLPNVVSSQRDTISNMTRTLGYRFKFPHRENTL
jgi:hypothetical protein